MPFLRRLIAGSAARSRGAAQPWLQSGYYPQRQPQRHRARSAGFSPRLLSRQARAAGAAAAGLQPAALVRRSGIRRPSCTRPRAASRPPARGSVARQEKPKVDPTTYVVVFGDSLAESPDRASMRISPNPGRGGDPQGARRWRPRARRWGDWPNKAILDGGQKTTVGVVMLGTNDRQPIREGEETFEPLSDRWKALYRQRVDAVANVFQERGIPVVWIGLPPMKNDKISDDLIAMNEIYKESVLRNGGTYVDIWPGFVDEENRYTHTAPMWTDSPPSCAPMTACSSPGPAPARSRISPTRKSSGSSGSAAPPRLRCPRRISRPRMARPTVHRGGDPGSAGRRCTVPLPSKPLSGRSCRSPSRMCRPAARS